MKAKEIVASFLMAFGLGVFLGVLFAPKKGSKTRQKIINKALVYTSYLKKN